MTQRFLFAAMEGGGNAPPVLGLAQRLAARGHEVRLLGDPALAEDARRQGLTLVPFRHAPHHNFRSRERDRVRDWAAQSPLRAIQRVTAELMFEPAHAYARDVLEQLEQFAADVVVVDYMIIGAALGAEKAGVPSALLMHTPYSFPAPHTPPFGLGLLPARGLLGRARDRVLGALSRAWFEHLGRAPVNRARRALGLAPLSSVFEQPSRSERLLVMTASEFDFASRGPLPDNVRYVGPGLEDPVWTEPYAPEPPASDAPLVVVGLGSTFQNQAALTGRVIEALAGMPVQGLVTLGDVFDPGELPACANVRVVRSAPHGAVFPRASAVIAHGGHGTVMKALRHGLPLLCLPMGRDQNDNAARVFAAGAGLRLAPGASAAQIRASLSRLLREPSFAEASRRMAAAIARYQREDLAVRELEQLAQRPNVRAVA